MTIALLISITLVAVPPIALVAVIRVTRLPFQAGSLHWMYPAWLLFFGASSVWNLYREVRFSAEEAGVDNFVRLALLTLGLLLLLFIGARHRFSYVRELLVGVLGLFFAFSLWGMFSTLWSVSPAATLYKSIEYCAMLLLFAATISLVCSFKYKRTKMLALKSIFDWYWFLVCASLVAVYAGIFVLPEYAVEPNAGVLGFRIQGALPAISANGVGQFAAILGIVALVRVLFDPASRTVHVPVLVFCLGTLILAGSRSPILAFVVAVVIVLVASRRFGALALSATSAGLVMLSAFSHVIYDFFRRGQADNTIATLTGRTEYWQASFEALRENPLTGFGANAGGRYVLESAFGETGVSTVHSLWVEVVVDTGLIGLILFVTALLTMGFFLINLRHRAASDPISYLLWLESLGVLAVLLVRSVFAVNLVWSTAVLILGLVIIYIAVMRRQDVAESHAGAALAQPLPAARRRGSSILG